MASYGFDKFFLENPRDYNYDVASKLSLQLFFLLYTSPLINWEDYRTDNGFYIPVHLQKLNGNYNVTVGDPPIGGSVLTVIAPKNLNLEACSGLVFQLLETFNLP